MKIMIPQLTRSAFTSLFAHIKELKGNFVFHRRISIIIQFRKLFYRFPTSESNSSYRYEAIK